MMEEFHHDEFLLVDEQPFFEEVVISVFDVHFVDENQFDYILINP
jgi:hypothetical protein